MYSWVIIKWGTLYLMLNMFILASFIDPFLTETPSVVKVAKRPGSAPTCPGEQQVLLPVALMLRVAPGPVAAPLLPPPLLPHHDPLVQQRHRDVAPALAPSAQAGAALAPAPGHGTAGGRGQGAGGRRQEAGGRG